MQALQVVRQRGATPYEGKRSLAISSLLKTQISQSEMARILGVSKTITDFGWAYIEELLSRKYSPEQITGRLRYLGWEDVPSHERIHQYIYADKKSGGKLHKHLRCQKKYRKRGYANHDRRGQLSECIDISQRPAEAEAWQRLGDYEGDTVIGKGHKGALVTLVDRASREIKIKALPCRKADLVGQACIDLLASENPKSITFDNGKEFAQHRSIAEALDTEVYFARPYHSWERGSNENANGLIRQFLTKSVSLDKLTAEFVQAIEDNLNNRPRKF